MTAAMRPGDVVDFTGYSPDEIDGESFAPGDVLVVIGPSAMADGIDARNWFTGTVDMVWPEEVAPL